MNNYTIRLKNISKYFGKRQVLENVSFGFEKGVLGIAGSNGSGKSTLIKCMAGILRPSDGCIDWRTGQRTVALADIRKKLGYAAPYINLYNGLTCCENLSFLLRLRNISSKEKRINEVLGVTGIARFSDQLFQNLSTGQRQRLRLSAALVHRPEILFLDEPVSNLDEEGRQTVHSIVEKFKQIGKLVIIATNNQSELNICDKIYSVEKEAFYGN